MFQKLAQKAEGAVVAVVPAQSSAQAPGQRAPAWIHRTCQRPWKAPKMLQQETLGKKFF